MRTHDWARTPFGPPETWPQSLRSAVSICLGARFPIAIYWGPELALLYNDAWSSIPGKKHPWALGRSGRDVWPEIWDTIGPLFETVQATGEGVWQEDQLLPMHRHGYTEECYFNFTFSPIRGEEGGVEGIFNAVIETTFRVIGERRERTLRELAEHLTGARTEDDVFTIAAQTLAARPADVPFCLFYLLDSDGRQARLAGLTGIAPGGPASPGSIDLADAAAPWPLARVIETGRGELIDDLSNRFGSALPGGPWPEPTEAAFLAPIASTAQPGAVAGFLVAGISPRRMLDNEYRAFIERAAAHAAATLANARAYEEERKRAEALAVIDRAKTAFFSNISHEFRTPLTLMLGPLEEALADGERLLPEQREQLAVVHRNGLRLLKLVNALLDFSRIEAGRVRASFEPTDLSAFTAELASNFRSATEKAGLTLIVDCPPLAEPVHVDRDMWEKIVLNLLSNAFKFTFEGEIAVALRLGDGAAELTVRDTGTGIPAHELPRLFERFHRVEGARGRSYEGSGIGLALVQELVKLHGGAIGVESEEGLGTTFVVSIPLGTAHLPQDRIREARPLASTAAHVDAYVEEALRWLPEAAPFEETIERASLSLEAVRPIADTGERPRILLADDNADMRAYLCRLLAARHDVQAVGDGQAALEAIRARRPDLLLTDIMMPRLDGFGVLGAIREDPELRDLPVIVLSARAGEEASVEGLDAGADDYLIKPFSARELIARVNAALALARVRRQVTEALRESEERFRHMADNAPVMVRVTDRTGSCTYLSRSWYALTGQTESECLGHGWLDAAHPDDRADAYGTFAAANEKHEAFRLEYRLRGHDGVYRWVIDAAAPRFGEDGAFLGYIGSVIDISERKEVEEAQRRLNEMLEQRVAAAVAEREAAEAQLRQVQKMEAVGQLTGGVAHDFNNLLTVIIGNLDALQRHLGPDAEARLRRAADNALRGASRAAALTQRLLAFARRQPLEPKPIDVNRLVAGMSDLLRRTLGEQVRIETVLAGGLWRVEADPAQLESALLNLAVNARDAMPEGGKLTVETANAHLDEAYAAVQAEAIPGQYIMIAMTDTGTGMTKEVLERAFEPFFTTKPTGHGTGLGLSQVYGFIKQSGGHTKIYSEPGAGTTVKIYLPRLPGIATEEEEAQAPLIPEGRYEEVVLVVEDDDDVRAYSTDLLRELGYRVLEAPDGPTALRVLEGHSEVKLLFTDVGLPGMTGRQLADEACVRHPGLKVLFTTGYARNAIVHNGRLDPGVQMLSKPFTRADLAAKIRDLIDAGD